MSIVPESSRDLGNSITKSKQISPSKRWCFTLNNYTDEEISSIVPLFNKECSVGFFSKEVGASGTPHLQGYVEFKEKCRPAGKATSRIWWTKAKGSKADNISYCKKQENLFWSKGIPLPVRVILPDYEWEKEILEIIELPPDDRSIYWYYGVGGIGKTAFCKYLTVKHGAICLGGKGADMRNGVVEYVKYNGDTPRVVLINLPRTFNIDYVSYEGIENVKDMYFYSGKYEGGMICGNPPHVIVFANDLPDEDKLSEDRWKIRNIPF